MQCVVNAESPGPGVLVSSNRSFLSNHDVEAELENVQANVIAVQCNTLSIWLY